MKRRKPLRGLNYKCDSVVGRVEEKRKKGKSAVDRQSVDGRRFQMISRYHYIKKSPHHDFTISQNASRRHGRNTQHAKRKTISRHNDFKRDLLALLHKHMALIKGALFDRSEAVGDLFAVYADAALLDLTARVAL